MTAQRLPTELIEALADVRSIGVITGAGVSAESGIRPYRGQGGLYDDPDEGERTVEALSGPCLATDPDRTWRVVASLARQAESASPNAAHRAIVRLEELAERFVLLTQNVDGLHQDAGSRNVIDIHGNVFATSCMACGAEGHLERTALAVLDRAPRCQRCEGTLRPAAVLFGELLPVEKLARLQAELLDNPPDLVLAAGTTAVFPYIQEPLFAARAAGRVTVEINPEPTELSDVVEYTLRGPAGELLPALAEVLAGGRAGRP